MTYIYEVIVQNIGRIYVGSNKFDAIKAYDTYVGFSKRGYGRAAGEGVDLYENGLLIKEYIGKNDEDLLP